MSLPFCHFRFSIFVLETFKFKETGRYRHWQYSQYLELNHTCGISAIHWVPLTTNTWNVFFYDINPKMFRLNCDLQRFIYMSESNIASRWIHRECYLMFTLNSDKDQRKIHFRSNINEPLQGHLLASSARCSVTPCMCTALTHPPHTLSQFELGLSLDVAPAPRNLDNYLI